MISRIQESGTADAAAAGKTLQREWQLQQKHHRSLPTSTIAAKQAVEMKHVSFLQSFGTSEGTKDPALAALLCSSEALSSDSIQQEYATTEDSGLCGFDIAAAAAAAAASPCVLSQGDEGMADSGLDVHLLDASPGCNDSSSMAAMQLARAGQTPARWAPDGNLASDGVAADDPAAAHADAEHTPGCLEDSHAVLLLSACMHEGVVQALSFLSHSDGLPFRHKDGTGEPCNEGAFQA